MRQAMLAGIAMALVVLPVRAQTAAEHASHHPGAPAAAASAMPPATSPAVAAGGPVAAGLVSDAKLAAAVPAGMAADPPMAAAPAAPGMAGGGMGQMMAEMMGMMMPMASPAGAAPPAMAMAPGTAAAGSTAAMAAPATAGCMGAACGAAAASAPIYASLMALPAITTEKRADIDALASQQLSVGMRQLTSSYEALNRAAQASDYAAMQQSIGLMREAQGQVAAGVAARRLLAEGKSPRNLALDWFKREMNLATPIIADSPPSSGGVRLFHLLTMLLLIAFALAMVLIYILRMRRAAALFGRLEGGPGGPPPGSSPSPSGTPGPIPPSGPATILAEIAAAAPLSAKWRGQLRLGSVITETPSVKTLRLLPASGEGLLPFSFLPGQFLNLCLWIGGAKMIRSYSISSSPMQRGFVDLTIKREPRGAVSRHLDDLLKAGDLIEASGPVGKFTFTGAEASSIVLIAGGVGITPMMSIARSLSEQSWPGDIYFIYACRAPDDFIFAKPLAALQQGNSRLHLTVTMEHPEGSDWAGAGGRITRQLLTQAVPALTTRRVHLCGPQPMMEAVKALLSELGVPAEQVKTEDFGTAAPAPADTATSAKPTAPATGPMVSFARSNQTARSRSKQTVLELSEELGIGIEFACRVGTCGVCKVAMTSGEVEMAIDDALDAEDKARGLILACQARPKRDCVVEA